MAALELVSVVEIVVTGIHDDAVQQNISADLRTGSVRRGGTMVSLSAAISATGAHDAASISASPSDAATGDRRAPTDNVRAQVPLEPNRKLS